MSHYRKLGKPTDQRVAMLRAMTTYLLENGQIKTTVSRAKEVAPIAEKMITLAKNANLANYRRALSWLTKEDVAKKLFDEIGPKYASRNGGYTRVVKIGPRRGDAAEMAIVTKQERPRLLKGGGVLHRRGGHFWGPQPGRHGPAGERRSGGMSKLCRARGGARDMEPATLRRRR